MLFASTRRVDPHGPPGHGSTGSRVDNLVLSAEPAGTGRFSRICRHRDRAASLPAIHPKVRAGPIDPPAPP